MLAFGGPAGVTLHAAFQARGSTALRAKFCSSLASPAQRYSVITIDCPVLLKQQAADSVLLYSLTLTLTLHHSGSIS